MSTLRFEVIDKLNVVNVPNQHPRHMKYYDQIVVWDHVKHEVKANATKYSALDVIYIHELCEDLNRVENDRMLYLKQVFAYGNEDTTIR